MFIMFLKQRASTECGRSGFHPGTESFEKLPLIKVVDQEGGRGRRKETESAGKIDKPDGGSCILCVGPLFAGKQCENGAAAN
jgi:hypothetical protein